MSKKFVYPFVVTATILMVTSALATSNHQRDKQDESAVYVPILKVTDSDGHWARAPILEGQVLTREDEKTGIGFSFTTEWLKSEKSVQVRIDKIDRGSKSETLETLKLVIGAPAVKSSKSLYKIEIQFPLRTPETQAVVREVAYQPATLNPATALTSASALTQGGNCCVMCNGIRTCANCSVVVECGCCCTPSDRCCLVCQ